MNIVFSTTRQTNPGDEFILIGILNLLRSLGIRFNPLIYNRNPDVVRQERFFNGLFWKTCRLFFRSPRSRDNSFLPTQARAFGGNSIDYAIFAGSPSWIGRPTVPLLEYIGEHKIPYMFLGSGKVVSGHYLRRYPSAISGAEVCALRDQRTFDFARRFNPKAILIPCPALLCAARHQEKQITEVRKVALVCRFRGRRSHLSAREYCEYTDKLYAAVMAHFRHIEFEFVAHYISELYEFDHKRPVHYSYDPQDYFAIYKQFDYVIGSRIHGSGISASIGIPSTIIKHDVRGGTADGFLTHGIEVTTPIDDVIQYLETLFSGDNIRKKNAEILEHKWKTMAEYQRILKESCSLCAQAQRCP